ncbi:MAG: DUF5069 domain-containing protein [Candidatus Latescibacterota bacterium]
MGEQSVLDFKPRARGMLIGGIPWLARITDKARASLAGRIGDYIYPCPADQRFLAEVGMSAEEFTELVVTSPDDDEVIRRVQAHVAATRPSAAVPR